MTAVASDEHILSGLNTEQRVAATYCDGPVQIIAGAGTGKTRVIVARFAHLVESRGVPAERILSLTFSSKAAGEMRQRILATLPGGYGNLWVHTFHSFCLRILRELDPYEVRLLSEVERRTLLSRVVLSGTFTHYYTGSVGLKRLLDDAMTLIGRAKDYLISPDDFADFAEYKQSERLRELAQVYRAYQDVLDSIAARDFGDLASALVRRFEADSSLRARYAARFVHVIVDEFQDTNEVQYRLLRALVGPDGNLCVVGDPDQSIYAFRGAALAYIERMANDYPSVKHVHLPTNYRSHQRILNAAMAVIGNNPVGDRAALVASSNDERGRVTVTELPTEEAEARHVAGMIAKYVREDGLQYHDCAVLCRSVGTSGGALASAFAAYTIPYHIGGLVAADYETIEDIIAALRVVDGSADWAALRRLLVRRDVGGNVLHALEGRLRIDPERSADSLSRSLTLSASERACCETLRTVCDELRSLAPLSLDQLLYYILLKTGNMHDAIEPRATELARSLLAEAAAAVEAQIDLAAFIVYLEQSYRSNEDDLSENAQPPGRGPGVAVLTVHAAKGLEWPVVFVTGLTEGRFPLPMRLDRALDLDELCRWEQHRDLYTPEPEAAREVNYRAEERRLCYVAMTRARRALHLTRAQVYDDGQPGAGPFVDEARRDEGGVAELPPVVQPRTEREVARSLHEAMTAAVEVPVRQTGAATAIAHVLTAQWAAQTLDGAIPLRHRTLPTPNEAQTALRLSYSQVDTYQTCPRQYLYQYVLGLRREQDSPHRTYGTAVHVALKSLNTGWRESGEVPAAPEITAALDAAFRAVTFGLRGLAAQARRRAEVQLQRLYAYERGMQRRPMAVEEQFTMAYGAHTFTGWIDCVLQDATTGIYTLIDYKTGRGEDLKAPDSLQLFLYERYWAREHAGAQIAVAYYLLKHPGDKGMGFASAWEPTKQIRQHVHTPETGDALGRVLDDTLARMLGNRFVAEVGLVAETCHRCPYNVLCPESIA